MNPAEILQEHAGFWFDPLARELHVYDNVTVEGSKVVMRDE